jgi:hypothetical protein
MIQSCPLKGQSLFLGFEVPVPVASGVELDEMNPTSPTQPAPEHYCSGLPAHISVLFNS